MLEKHTYTKLELKLSQRRNFYLIVKISHFNWLCLYQQNGSIRGHATAYFRGHDSLYFRGYSSTYFKGHTTTPFRGHATTYFWLQVNYSCGSIPSLHKQLCMHLNSCLTYMYNYQTIRITHDLFLLNAYFNK